MNKIKFLYKFYIKKQLKGHYNWNLLFPFFGVIMGCMTVALTLAIMEGMEYAIFNRLKNVSFPAKLTHVFNGSNYSLENYLIKQKLDYINGMEDQVLIIKDSSFRLFPQTIMIFLKSSALNLPKVSSSKFSTIWSSTILIDLFLKSSSIIGSSNGTLIWAGPGGFPL